MYFNSLSFFKAIVGFFWNRFLSISYYKLRLDFSFIFSISFRWFVYYIDVDFFKYKGRFDFIIFFFRMFAISLMC